MASTTFFDDVSPRDIQNLLLDFERSFSTPAATEKYLHKGRPSDGDVDSPSSSHIINSLIQVIPILLKALEHLEQAAKTVKLEKRNQALLEETELERAKSDNEELFYALKDSESRHSTTMLELRRTQSLAAQLEVSTDKEKKEAELIRLQLQETEEKRLRLTENSMSEENQELRQLLHAANSHISSLKASKSSLKFQFLVSSRKVADLEAALVSLSTECAESELKVKSLEFQLQIEVKRVKSLEEQISCYTERGTKEDLEEAFDNEECLSFRDEIEESARIALGNTEEKVAGEEDMFTTRTDRRKGARSMTVLELEELKKQYFVTGSQVKLHRKVTETSIIPVSSSRKYIWKMLFLPAFLGIVLLLFQARVGA